MEPIPSRTIFVGDVHGCVDELRSLIACLHLSPNDRVIMLGDLINRGPDPASVVEFVAGHDFECLLGNHELDYLQEVEHSERYQRLRERLGEELHRWILALPSYIEDDRFIAVHAGLEPGKHPADSTRRVLANIRTWDGSGQELSNPAYPPWYSFYTGRRPVFYGHWARRGLNIRQRTFGLDSGCVYGRCLSAYILESGELVQVPAARQYYVPPSLRKTRDLAARK